MYFSLWVMVEDRVSDWRMISSALFDLKPVIPFSVLLDIVIYNYTKLPSMQGERFIVVVVLFFFNSSISLCFLPPPWALIPFYHGLHNFYSASLFGSLWTLPRNFLKFLLSVAMPCSHGLLYTPRIIWGTIKRVGALEQSTYTESWGFYSLCDCQKVT